MVKRVAAAQRPFLQFDRKGSMFPNMESRLDSKFRRKSQLEAYPTGSARPRLVRLLSPKEYRRDSNHCLSQYSLFALMHLRPVKTHTQQRNAVVAEVKAP